MHSIRAVLTTTMLTAALGCGRNQERAPAERPAADTSRPTAVSTAPALSRMIGDTEIVRSPGLPSDSDDTASTQYGKHQTPRRLATPACRPRGIAICLLDTAQTVFSVTCCAADERQTNWLVFAAARDSMQFFLWPPGNAYLTMSPNNAEGAGAETSQGVDASWLRARFPAAGTYVFTAGMESDQPAPYELRVAPVIATGATQPTGASARLTLTGRRRAKIAVAPRSMMPRDPAALRRFAVDPGGYRVLLVRDTLYAACELPCKSSTTFALVPGQSATVSP